MEICELGEAQWQPLRRGLEQTGLIQAENVQGFASPFLRFHPTLAPALWARLPAKEQAVLTARYQERYYHVSGVLYQQDTKAVAAVRAIARREYPTCWLRSMERLIPGRPGRSILSIRLTHSLASSGLAAIGLL